MKQKRFTDEQIIGILKEADAGMVVADLCRKHGMSSATFYAWKSKYGGLELSEARRLRIHPAKAAVVSFQAAAAVPWAG